MNQSPNISEQTLVAGCIDNKRAYQEILYKQYFPTMMRMCLRYTQDEDKAMQIVNNGFLKVFQKIGQYSGKGSLEGWIRRIVFHALSDYFKKENRQIKFLELADRDDVSIQEGLSNLLLEDLFKLIDLLPNATRDVFYLYAVEGYTHREIAAEKNISEGTSKWHLNAARKQLKQWIKQQNDAQYHAK